MTNTDPELPEDDEIGGADVDTWPAKTPPTAVTFDKES